MKRSEKQVLVTGCYRSGTEYIALLLGNHPELAVSLYTLSFMRFCYGRYNPLNERPNYTKLVFDAAERIRTRWRRQLNSNSILDYCDKCDNVDYALLYDLMMSDLFLSDSVCQWAEKEQLAWTKIPAFLDMFPNGNAVLVIRDPRSVLASFRQFTYAKPPAYLGAVFNCFDAMNRAQEYKKTLNPDQFCIVRYEDIILEPEATLRNLFSCLGLSADHDLLSQKGWLGTKGESWKHNSVFKKSGVDFSDIDKIAAVHRWKDHLSSEEIALCESVNGQLMGAFRYEISGVSVPWQDMIKQLLFDEQLTHFLYRWVSLGEGVEEFPTDPLNPENWAESV